MNTKEISELRRRWAPDKNAVTHIYGCFVNGAKHIVSDIDESVGLMPQEKAEQYLSLLRKTMSGKLGRNLLDIPFSAEQVTGGEEHRLLSVLRSSGLKDDEARRTFYRKIIENVDMEGSNYLILLAHDTYDVPYRGRDGEERKEMSGEVFPYIVCAVCPVKDGKVELGYFPRENDFRCASGHTVAVPEMGFVFPAFDDRSANIYSALCYSRNTELLHEDFIRAVFCTEPPLSAGAQRNVFCTSLGDALGEECTLGVMQSVYGELNERILLHKESKNPEAPSMTQRELSVLLQDCGVSERSAGLVCEELASQLGKNAAVNPANLVAAGKCEIKTEQAAITLPQEYAPLVELRLIDGRKYLLVPVEGGVEFNGMPVQ